MAGLSEGCKPGGFDWVGISEADASFLTGIIRQGQAGAVRDRSDYGYTVVNRLTGSDRDTLAGDRLAISGTVLNWMSRNRRPVRKRTADETEERRSSSVNDYTQGDTKQGW